MQLFISQFHFLYPHWLWLLPLPLLVAVIIIWQQRRHHNLRQLVDASLLPYLLQGKTRTQLMLPMALLAIGLLALAALAGPSWEKQPQAASEQQTPLVIALSLARSMYANDLAPSRLARARFKAHDLLDANAAGSSALVGFAGAAFTVAPLTRDGHSLTRLLDNLSPDVMPVDGNNAGAAISRSARLIHQAGNNQGLVILITDEANSAAIKQARLAHQQGVTVSVLGIGGSKRVPITQPNGALLHDASGQLVFSARDDTLLSQLANAGGGNYQIATNNNVDIQQLTKGLAAISANNAEKTLSNSDWVNMGPWLLLPLVLLFALLFRQGWLLILVIAPLTFSPPSQAADWQQHWTNLWQRNDQQAATAIAKQQPERAEKLAKDPNWKGAGAYQAGHFDAAAEAFRQSNSDTAHYNLANALAKSGDLKAAVDAYQQALQQNPNNSDASYNLKQVKNALQQQQQKKQQQKASKNGDNRDQSTQANHGAGGSNGNDSSGDNRKNADNGNQKSQSNSAADQAAAAQPEDKKGTADAKQALSDKLDQALQQQADNKAGQQARQKADTQQPAHDLGKVNPDQHYNKLPADAKRLLDRVPDEPGSLLKRKFMLDYQQRTPGGN